MSQKKIDAVLKAIRTPPRSSSWLAWARNQLTRGGLRSSATPVSRLFDQLPKRNSILLVGLDAAGKTTLLRNYFSQDCGRDIATHMPSIGWVVEEVSYGNVSIYTLDLGCARPGWFIKLQRSLVAEMEAVVWVLDCSDRDRFVEAKEEFQRIVLAGKGPKRGAPILFLATKPDSQNAIKRREYEQNFASICGSRTWHIAEADVRTGDGLIYAFKWLSDQLLGRPTEEMTEKTKMPQQISSGG